MASADQDDAPDPAGQGGPQRGEVRALVLAAQDEDDGRFEALHRLDRGLDRGGLGIVDEGHTVHGQHRLQPVGQAAEGADGLAHGRGGTPISRPARAAAMTLSRLWAPEQGDLGRRHQDLLGPVQPQDDLAAAQERAALQPRPGG